MFIILEYLRIKLLVHLHRIVADRVVKMAFITMSAGYVMHTPALVSCRLLNRETLCNQINKERLQCYTRSWKNVSLTYFFFGECRAR